MLVGKTLKITKKSADEFRIDTIFYTQTLGQNFTV